MEDPKMSNTYGRHDFKIWGKNPLNLILYENVANRTFKSQGHVLSLMGNKQRSQTIALEN